jgi:preprotein translocase subunit YajC
VDGSGALLLILLFGLMYVLVVLPRRRQMAKTQQLQSSLTIGRRVVTIGGIKGEVVGLHDASVEVMVAPDVVVTFVREAIANVEAIAGMTDDQAPDDPSSDTDPTTGTDPADRDGEDDS